MRVRPARAQELDALAEVLVTAFGRDPLALWLHPDAAERERRYRKLFRATLHSPDPGQEVFTNDALSAVSVWRPVSTRPPRSPPDAARGEADALFAAIADQAPEPPYRSLAFLGAVVSGAGLGGELLRHGLATTKGPAALWTGNLANLPFYRKAGFELACEVGRPVRAWWMVRPAPA